MTKDETIYKLWETSNHGTLREDIEAAYNAGAVAEREACAKVCEALWQEEATAAANGTQVPKYHDCIECAHAIRERSNAELRGASRLHGEASLSNDVFGGRLLNTPDGQNGCQNCTHEDCEARDNGDTSSCRSHSLKTPN